MCDGARGHIAVDGQLFAWHAVQRKTRANFGHAGSTFGDDHEVDDQQYAKHDQAEEHVAAHHEVGKPLDDIARRIGAGMAFTDDQLG